jgi:glycerol-3-phosphate O-acyltransferase/dihydroxyacetone phosphate acyltransferase
LLQGVVPVRRAQDNAKAGAGRIQMKQPIPAPTSKDDENDPNIDDDNNKKSKEDNDAKEHEKEEEKKIIMVTGFDTKFTEELVPGDKVRPDGTGFGLKVMTIESDTSMIVDGTGLPSDFPMHLFDSSGKDDGKSNVVTYDLLKRTPLTKVFEKVLDRLAGRGAVGIFPEGGSHDRTDLLPLKVGVSLIAYSALEKDGINVPIVPVGLSYFRAHRWRGRAVVEYGRPIMIDPATLSDFKAGGAARHKVCNAFLEDIKVSMRSVIVSAPDYETLELIHTARRLYRRQNAPLDTMEKQDLSRRFVEGYKRLLLMTDAKFQQEGLDLQSRIKEYRNELKEMGLSSSSSD